MIQSATPQWKTEPFEVGAPRNSILIVDDDHDQVFCLRERLQNLGFETIAAHRGDAALDLAENEHPDLVLLDLRLPDANGLDVCSRLSDSPSTWDIPVIILSAVEGPDIIRSSRAAGCTFFVRKPYDPNALLALIECSLHDEN
ncbi:MAG: response regulator [Pirellulaceae bacterium]|jgi:CheY-like chemotaxis protein|nr:response regulator [Pirellulaceae bacterium]MDP7016167.1 response regulator [Pirellulaceae bacterium]